MMREAVWLGSSDPTPMLAFLRGNASDRKLLLFAAASFRHLHYLLPDARQHQGIELLEQMADGNITLTARREVTRLVRHALPSRNFDSRDTPADDPHYVALMLYRALVSSSAAEHALQAPAGLADGAAKQKEQCRLLRDIFSPFRPVAVVEPAILSWNDGCIPKIAHDIYDERRFEAMPILADALEESGCSDAEILTHCRSEGPHTRGCWALDWVLEKE